MDLQICCNANFRSVFVKVSHCSVNFFGVFGSVIYVRSYVLLGGRNKICVQNEGDSEDGISIFFFF